jgi:hypothetical protein
VSSQPANASSQHSKIRAINPIDDKSTLGIVNYAHGILVTWKSKKQTIVAQSTMKAEMITTAYGKVQIDWRRYVTSEIELGTGTR